MKSFFISPTHSVYRVSEESIRYHKTSYISLLQKNHPLSLCMNLLYYSTHNITQVNIVITQKVDMKYFFLHEEVCA